MIKKIFPIKALLKKLKVKLRFILYNDSSFEEIFNIKLTGFNIIIILTLISALLITLTTLIIAYTPIKEYLLNYPKPDLIISAISNKKKVDSLYLILNSYENYINNLKNLIKKGEPLTIDTIKKIKIAKNQINPNIKPSKEDTLFRMKYEEEAILSIKKKKDLSDYFFEKNFFKPTKGIVIREFNENENHFGIDIATKNNEPVYSIAKGKVIFSDYSSKYGLTIIIQHNYNLISVYKHLSVSLIKENEEVEEGKIIGIVGNTGFETNGPHLHFEIWYNGQPINPNNFINF